ncbi:hypothetical protein JXA63_02920 [Candidatus Woesebacteria bacterium]|nr:hypothetical protein [Candidatus Woesebacteria bacterium]
MKRKKIIDHAPFIILIVIISLFSVRGYLFGMTSTLPTKGSDDSIITWILNQTIQKIPYDLGNIFNGNIFYPYKNTLAYSVMMIPSAIVAYLPTVLSGSYLTAFNFTVVFSQLTCGIILYLIFYEISNNKYSSAIALIALILSKIRMSAGVHIHVFVMQYFLLGVYLFIKFKKTKKITFLYLTFLMMGIQVWESEIQVIFLLISCIIIVALDLNIIKKYLKHFVLGSFFSIIIALPPALSYIKVVMDFGRPRGIREVAHFSASIDQLWTSYWSTGLYMLFIMAIFITLTSQLRKNKYLKAFVFITMIGAVFSLGPVLKWNFTTIHIGKFFVPLPYGIIYYLFPPLWAIRSVSRYIWLMAFGMAGVISVVLASLNRKFLKIFFLPLITIAVLGGVFNSSNYQYPDTDNYEKVYQFIRNSDASSIAEYPFFGVDNNHGEEMKRMVYSLYHKKALFNGASGFIPPERSAGISKIKKAFPNEEFIKILQKDKTDYFVVHKQLMSNEDFLKLKSKYEDIVVYEDKASLVLDIRNYLI